MAVVLHSLSFPAATEQGLGSSQSNDKAVVWRCPLSPGRIWGLVSGVFRGLTLQLPDRPAQEI